MKTDLPKGYLAIECLTDEKWKEIPEIAEQEKSSKQKGIWVMWSILHCTGRSRDDEVNYI